jgi:hypothetical protein
VCGFHLQGSRHFDIEVIGRTVIPKPIYKTTRCHILEYLNISNIGNDVKSKNCVHQEETRVRLVSESAFCRSVYGIFFHVASQNAMTGMYKRIILLVALVRGKVIIIFEGILQGRHER